MESNYAEENISTEQPPPREKARVQGEDGDEERPRRAEAPPREGAQAPDRTSLLSFRLPKEARIAKRADFLRVYEHGKRFEGRFMTVFILPGAAGFHRLGVTASKKAIGGAVERNRAKRLLREAFRLSRAELDTVPVRYDWVLNARKSLLAVKLDRPMEEFRSIIEQVKSF